MPPAPSARSGSVLYVNYVIPKRRFRGTSFTYRNGKFRSNNLVDRDEHRLFVSYLFDLL